MSWVVAKGYVEMHGLWSFIFLKGDYLKMFIPVYEIISLEEILKRLNDKDWTVRYSTCLKFGPVRNDIPIEEILKRLNDDDWYVRMAACEVFGPARKDIPIEEVVKRLTDIRDEVRTVARAAFSSRKLANKEPTSVDRHASVCRELNALYEKKNHDYGDSFHRAWLDEGYAMARIRLSDKMNRFKNLTLKDSENDLPLIQDESIRDTLLDLANYAIMTIMELDASSLTELNVGK